MSVQQPVWRKRTRPCPFFSQGRCLFADSCNFLHDVRVRNGLELPLSSASQARQPPSKPVFDPPSVVVDSASPRSVNLAHSGSLPSPVQDSSRYSGLLSVLSDVIGPLSSPPAIASQATPAIPSVPQSTACGPADSVPDLDAVVSGVESTSTETELCAEATCMLPFDAETTLDEPYERPVESFFLEEDGEPVTGFLPVADDAESSVVDGSSYIVEDAVGSERDDDEDTNDHVEEDCTVMVPNRHSTLSSFTGASLLASPQNSVLEECSVPCPAVDGAVDLLSPVELSAKLRPFSIPSLGFKAGKGHHSIDSGYADGEGWASPLPFPYSPPRHTQPSSHSRRASHASLARKTDDAGDHNPIGDIAEVESEHGYTTHALLDAYDASPSEGGDRCAVHVTVATEHDPAVVSRHLLCDLDRSFVSDDVSFRTALSACDGASPPKQDSLFSSTPDPSHYSDADEPSQSGSVSGPASEDGPAPERIINVAAEEPLTDVVSSARVDVPQEADPREMAVQSGGSADRLQQSSPDNEVAPWERLPGTSPPAGGVQASVPERVRSGLELPQRRSSDIGPCLKPGASGSDEADNVTLPLSLPGVAAPSGPALPDAAVADLPTPCALPQQAHVGASLTVSSPPPSNALASQRSRAASDLTVKAESPANTHVTRSPSPSPARPSSSLALPVSDDQTSTSPRESSPPSDGKVRTLSRSETVLRPFLTARRSSLLSFHPQFVPNAASPDSVVSVHHTSPTPRLQTRVIGSTMVPLGFRRQKPQPEQPLRSISQPLQTVLPASQLREVLRIRTDIPQEEFPSGCSSAVHVSSATRSPLPLQSMSAPPTGGLKPLCLSSIVHKRSSIMSARSSSIASSTLSLDHLFNSSTPRSPSVSSTTSFSHNSLLSSSCEQIPEQASHTLELTRSTPQTTVDAYVQPSSTHRDSRSVSPSVLQSKSWRLSNYRAGSRNDALVDGTRRFSRRTSTLSLSYAPDEEQETDGGDPITSHSTQFNHTDDLPCPASVLAPPVHAIATPKPTLLFAIASDDVNQVRQVLENGEAGPNDSVGPQSALAFTLTNDKLTHKPEIVKALLAYGANPSALRNPTLNPSLRAPGASEPSAPPPETTLEGMDPATRYFVARADAPHTRQTSQLIFRSFFRPLTRVRYDVIGQDWALEQLFRVLSMHSQKLAVAPIVVLLCGPSGHGKSLLARKFGFLLDVPTHTVNMTTVRSAHDIWQSFSMSPYEEPSSCTLAEFLIETEGKRCVVVLDEIEKVEDQKALWSLLMPWELGRCSFEAGKRHVDARHVIWLATSNIGHDLVFEYHENRVEPDTRMSRQDYLELMDMLRPRVSHSMGASLVSRVTTVLPFVPFTLDEKKAIAAEAIYAFAGDASKTLSPQEVESLVMKALPSYRASEGARSLHRVISNTLIDTF